MANITLQSDSNAVTIRSYFEGVLSLSRSHEEFPVNFDDVWQLCYNRKDHAVRTLREKFVNGIDYQAFPQNGERGAASKMCYMLSVSCLEYFIARKKREVFDVYRQVFHKSTQLSPAQALLQQAQLLVDMEERQRITEQRQDETERRTLAIETKLTAMEEERKRATDELMTTPLSEENVPELTPRNRIRKMVNDYSTMTGISQQDIWHNIYTQLYYQYGKSINSYTKAKRESNLDVAERNNLLPKIDAIISSLIYNFKKSH